MDESTIRDRFPRSAQYRHDWVRAGSMGSNVLWLAEWLCERLALRPGMRVLDLGCGRALSSIFMAREFDVEVWATDLWVSASENWQRIRDAGCDGLVHPIRSDARSLPFAAEFFDAITALDCYSYFGTDDLYLNYLVQFVVPDGPIGIAGAGLTREMTTPVPEHLREFWTQDARCLHSAAWWRQHWERTALVEIDVSDQMADAWRFWHHWQRTAWPDNRNEYEAIERDAGQYLGYIRQVGRRRAGQQLAEYAWPDNSFTVPYGYERHTMLETDG